MPEQRKQEDKFIAHIRQDGAVQTTVEHSKSVAALSAGYLSDVGLEQAGYMAGLLHDVGKLTATFPRYLRYGEKLGIQRGSINHTFAAPRYILTHYHKNEMSPRYTAAEILAIATGAHHGLYDCVDQDGESGFEHRRTAPDTDYREAIANLHKKGYLDKDLDARFRAANKELKATIEKIMDLALKSPDHPEDEGMFYLGLLSRLLLSAVVDADRMDTGAFMAGKEPPVPQESLPDAWQNWLWLAKVVTPQLPDKVKTAGKRSKKAQKVFLFNGLTEPLGHLTFAATQASVQRPVKRVVQVFRTTDQLVQHIDTIRRNHEALVQIYDPEKELWDMEKNEEPVEECAVGEWMDAGWTTPIVLTTLEQFTKILFSGDMKAVRLFHDLAGSALVVEDVQAIPQKMWTMFSLVINFLTEICGATVVFSSPIPLSFERIPHPIRTHIISVGPDDEATSRPHAEVRYEGRLTIEEIGTLAGSHIFRNKSTFVLCNTTAEAETVFNRLRKKAEKVYLVTGGMDRKARADTVRHLKQGYLKKGPVIFVSTKLVDVGIPFGDIVMMTCGLDRILEASALGKEGSLLHLVDCIGESLDHGLEARKTALRDLIVEAGKEEPSLDGFIRSETGMAYYVSALERRTSPRDYDYILPDGGTIYDLLSLNERVRTDTPQQMRQAFKMAGDLFDGKKIKERDY